MKTPDLETLLRSAPQPATPPDLVQNLRQNVRLPSTSAAGAPRSTAQFRGDVGRPRPWWWVGLLAGGLAAGAAALVWQDAEIRSLQTQLAASSVALDPAPAPGISQTVAEDPRAEIGRLEAEVARRSAELEAATKLAAENPSTGDASLTSATLSDDDFAALDAAKARGAAIACINNMKQIGLAVRIYAKDHGEKFPADFFTIQGELMTPKLLICPGDTNHQAAADWAAYTSANLSYEYLAPDGSEADSARVLTRCLVHGNIGLCDGSVQMNSTNRPLKIVNRQGKLYFE